MLDYLAAFPIPQSVMPERLRSLLVPVGLTPAEQVEVSCRTCATESERTEHVFTLMSVVPEAEVAGALNRLKSVNGHVVSSSVPVLGDKGNVASFLADIGGYDYIVASWGDGSSYTFNLAEKVWMALGLTPRCIGNQEQRLVYDDLSGPTFDVAMGEVSAEYYFKASRSIRWTLQNEYLRNYLWMRGAVGVRTFFYEGLLDDGPELRSLLTGSTHARIGGDFEWYVVDLREYQGKLLVQVWAAVVAVSCERCPRQCAADLVWPSLDGPMTAGQAGDSMGVPEVYLDARFLEKYEQDARFDSVPVNQHGRWRCNPKYRGQWAFEDCQRVGRDIVSVLVHTLDERVPEKELLHAHSFALSPEAVSPLSLEKEHIASKTERLLRVYLDLGDNLAKLGAVVGVNKPASAWVGCSRAKLQQLGWGAYPWVARLSQVAPLEMPQRQFLARCKGLHEFWQRVPDGLVRQLLIAAGVPELKLKPLKSLKLLQALLNVVVRLDEQHERARDFGSTDEPFGWDEPNLSLAPLFLNNDLRIADAHEAVDKCLRALESMGLDSASLNSGYGAALDLVFDGVIASFEAINAPLSRLLSR